MISAPLTNELSSDARKSATAAISTATSRDDANFSLQSARHVNMPLARCATLVRANLYSCLKVVIWAQVVSASHVAAARKR
jgi:hypothetical protein